MIKLKRSLLLTAVSFIVEIQYLLCETLLYMRKRIFGQSELNRADINCYSLVLLLTYLSAIKSFQISSQTSYKYCLIGYMPRH